MAPGLIAFDLDGTLLGADNRISDYTAAVVDRAAQAPGLVLVAVSGRGTFAAEHVLEPVPGVDYVICSNGALVCRRSAKEVLQERPLALHEVRECHTRVNGLAEGVCSAWDTTRGIVTEESFRRLASRPGWELDELRVSPHHELPDDPSVPLEQRLAPYGRILRQLLLHPEMSCRDLFTRLDGQVPGSPTRSSASFLEITARGVDKKTALELLCDRLGILPQDVVAFGDHMNDLTMLRWAGRGIAMCDGFGPLLKRIPEHTEVGHADDGVALTIETLLDGC